MGRRRKRSSRHHGVLVVDKPRGCTSHDVVQWARRVLGTTQVGHAGTLDPMATGVLVVAVGEGTKLVPYLTADDKRYEATIRLGIATDSLDADGEVIATAEVPPDLDVDRVAEVARGFVGAMPQRAPKVSAIKVGGRALHERVRRGEDVEAPIRDVVCHALEIRAVERSSPDTVDVAITLHTGKGYYVRSLGRDLAEALGTVGHLVALRRVESGAFGLDGALDGAILAGEHDDACRAATRAALRPLVEAVRGLGRVSVNASETVDLRHGRAIRASEDALDGMSAPRAAILTEGDRSELVAIVELRNDGLYHVLRGFPAREEEGLGGDEPPREAS